MTEASEEMPSGTPVDPAVDLLTSPDPSIAALPVLRTPVTRSYRYERCAQCEVHGTTYFHVYVKAEEVRTKKLPLDANPRLPVPGAITRKMEATLQNTPGDFHLLNNGITIIAASVTDDVETRELSLEFGAKAAHTGYGICNGGHTYLAITTLPQELDPSAIVRLEVVVLPQTLMEPERLKTIQRIANARNSHSALKSTTEANFFGLYDVFKTCLGHYSNSVRWREGDREAIPEALSADKFVALMAAISPEWYGHPRGGGDGNHLPAARNVKHVHSTWSKQRTDHLDSLSKGEVSTAKKHLDEIAPLAQDVLRLRDMVAHSLNDDSFATVPNWRKTALYQSVYKRQRKLIHDQYRALKGSELAHPHEAMWIGSFRHNVWIGTLEDDLDHPLVGWSVNPDMLWADNRETLMKKVFELVQKESKKSVADVLAKHVGAYSLQLMELQYGSARPRELDTAPYTFYMYDEASDSWLQYVKTEDLNAADLFLRNELREDNLVTACITNAEDPAAVRYMQV